MYNRLKSVIILIIVVSYLVLPDLFPGPIDDAIVLVLGGAAALRDRRNE